MQNPAFWCVLGSENGHWAANCKFITLRNWCCHCLNSTKCFLLTHLQCTGRVSDTVPIFFQGAPPTFAPRDTTVQFLSPVDIKIKIHRSIKK